MIFIAAVILLLLVAAWFYFSGVREGQSYTVASLPNSMPVVGDPNSPIFSAEALKELLKNADMQRLLGVSQSTQFVIRKSADGILFASHNPNIKSMNFAGKKIVSKSEAMSSISRA